MRHLCGALALLLLLLGAFGPAEGARLVRHGAITCDTTAGGVQIVAAQVNRRALAVKNAGTATVHIGSGQPGALTTSNGMPLEPGESLSFLPGEYTGVLSCIVASGSQGVRYLETLD